MQTSECACITFKKFWHRTVEQELISPMVDSKIIHTYLEKCIKQTM